MSVEAMAWVLNDAPGLPSHAAMALMGLANHADHQGRGAHPSQKTLKRYTRKTDRQVRRDLDALETAGLIRKGDQRLVAHYPADRRPVVWDLAMELREPAEPEDESPRTAGRQRPAGRTRPVVNVRPDVHDRADTSDKTTDQNGRTSASGRTYTTERPDVDVLQTIQEPTTEELLRSSSPPRKRGTGAAKGTRIPDDFAVTLPMVAWARENTPHVDGRTATAEFIDYWRGVPGARGLKTDWIATWRNSMRRAEKYALERIPQAAHTAAPAAEWCGHCNRLTREIENDRDQLIPCPTCSPRRHQ